MTVFTDFLAYKEGSYSKTNEGYKFNGNHVVKIVGYQKSMEGSTEWIVENTWGEDWGVDGYATIVGGRGDTGVEMFGIGAGVMPYTMYDYMSMQNMQEASMDATQQQQMGMPNQKVIPLKDLVQDNPEGGIKINLDGSQDEPI